MNEEQARKLIRASVITEKGTILEEANNQYLFKVDRRALFGDGRIGENPDRPRQEKKNRPHRRPQAQLEESHRYPQRGRFDRAGISRSMSGRMNGI